MRIAVIADIHANLTAFDAVIADWGTVDEVWCLGDVVGYGPDPDECVERLRALKHVCVAGNHDWAVLGKLDLADFNKSARMAAEWTISKITPTSRQYLADLPTMLERGELTLVHGSPSSPVWEYLVDVQAASIAFARFKTPHGLVGHSHVPLMFALDPARNRIGGGLLHDGQTVELTGARRIINPGSVGQPRDGDPRASYAILEDGTLTLHRVEYDVNATQERMRRADLPPSLVSRLQFGT